MPTAGVILQHVAKRHQQRARSLGGVEQPGIDSGELAAEDVGAGRGEEAVDLAPGEEDKTAEDDEILRVLAEHAEHPDADRFDREGDEHRILAADIVRDPAKEWPRYPIQDSVD